ncbi:MAG: rane or secreted protein [Adhaeribacter sp.]|nr:rane or secreted protein [Adhaeribacter sp.]
MKVNHLLNFYSLVILVLLVSTTFGFRLGKKESTTRFQQQPVNAAAKALTGAWQLVKTTDPAQTAPNVVKIMVDGYFTAADYNLNNKEFIGAQGGTYTLEKDRYTENLEYFTKDSTKVGISQTYTLSTKGNSLQLTGTRNGKPVTESWERLDAGDSPLAGAWRIRERETQPGQMSVIQRGPRKTIKWLSGKHFQWAAINTETKQFFGTGGGTYTLKDGKYTENIQFFSRDPKRVGMSISFDYEVKNGDWHHRGLSTAGNKIYEIWAKEK